MTMTQETMRTTGNSVAFFSRTISLFFTTKLLIRL